MTAEAEPSECDVCLHDNFASRLVRCRQVWWVRFVLGRAKGCGGRLFLTNADAITLQGCGVLRHLHCMHTPVPYRSLLTIGASAFDRA